MQCNRIEVVSITRTTHVAADAPRALSPRICVVRSNTSKAGRAQNHAQEDGAPWKQQRISAPQTGLANTLLPFYLACFPAGAPV